MRFGWRFGLIILTLVLALTACGGAQPAQESPAPSNGDADEVTHGTASVERVEIVMRESFPVQISAVASGNLPDGCTKIDQIEQERTDNTFRITISTIRPKEQACTMALVPFQEAIEIDALGLKAGKYTVEVNGVTAEFELAVDNRL